MTRWPAASSSTSVCPRPARRTSRPCCGTTAPAPASRACCCPGAGAASTCGSALVVREDPTWSAAARSARRAWDRLRRARSAAAPGRRAGQPRVLRRRQRGAGRARAGRPGGRRGARRGHRPRHAVGWSTARWQEYVKNGSTAPIDGYPEPRTTSPARRVGLGARSTCAGVLRALGRRAAAASGCTCCAAQAGRAARDAAGCASPR